MMKGVECKGEEAQVLAKLMSCIVSDSESQNPQMIQQCNFNKGLKTFGDEGKEAAVKEVRQQHARKCFALIAAAELTRQERQSATGINALSGKKRQCDERTDGAQWQAHARVVE